jgi:hypothetical protein
LKKGKNEPRPTLTLFLVGLFFLGVGYALSFILNKQTPIGGNVDNADLALAAGILLAGICWIVAWAKRK